MEWSHLTSEDLAAAARDVGVCVVPLGVLEHHGPHLPLGTDVLLAHHIARLAAEREPAVVFPALPFGKVYEATAFPGAVALRPGLLLELAENVFDEIGRNGFPKILLFSAHGGNSAWVRFVVQCNIAADKPYTLYAVEDLIAPDRVSEHEAICPIPTHEHAGVIETSLARALFPDRVREDRIPSEAAEPQGRLRHLQGLFTAVSWYADFPDHCAGDAGRAGREMGERLLDLYVDSLARRIAAVKADDTAPALRREFLRRAQRPADP